MTWRDALVLAGRSVRRRLGRSALTVAAVALAAALLTALLAIASTAQTRVLEQLSSGGPLSGISVTPAAGDAADLDEDTPDEGRLRPIDAADVERIEAIDGVEAVLVVQRAEAFVIRPERPRGGEPFVSGLVGVDLGRPSLLPVTVLEGRLPSSGGAPEVAVTEGWLERFDLDVADAATVLGTEAMWATGRLEDEGEEVRIRGRWVKATVVGVIAQDVGAGSMLTARKVVDDGRRWSASGVDGGRQMGVSPSTYAGLFVVADGVDQVGDVRAAITEVGFTTSAPENVLASVDRYLRVVEIILAAVGAIALAVAALGIANALLAAVRERRVEIGVLKAVGARDGDVRRVFLVEAAALGLLGGCAGATVGWGIARLVGEIVNRYLAGEGLATVTIDFPAAIMAATVLGTTLLAVVAGTVPAARAARLPASDAMGGS